MKLTNKIEVTDFLLAIKNAKGEVWLESKEGDRYNLKSTLARYVAIAALIEHCGNDLELFCALPEDEQLFYHFFEVYPNTL